MADALPTRRHEIAATPISRFAALSELRSMLRASSLPLSSAAMPLLLLPLAAHAAWLGPLAARAPPAPHAAASRAPAPVLLDYIKESHDWETSQTPFDYSQDADWLAEGVEVVRSQNPTMLPLLTRLRDFEFFRYFAVDLLAGCSYMPTQDEPCGLDACEIDPVDDEVPEGMRARDEDEYEFDLDAWARWDMPSDFTEYYDVTALGEGNTQYDGSRVWKFIHQKICFQKRLNDDESAWKRDFNRAISGMHSSVSAHIIADIERSGDIDEARARNSARNSRRAILGAQVGAQFSDAATPPSTSRRAASTSGGCATSPARSTTCTSRT